LVCPVRSIGVVGVEGFTQRRNVLRVGTRIAPRHNGAYFIRQIPRCVHDRTSFAFRLVLPCLASIALPVPAAPCQAKPRRASIASPRLASPCPASPRQALPRQHRLASPRRALPRQAQPASHRPASPSR